MQGLFSHLMRRDALHHSLAIVFVISQWDYFLGSNELYLQLGFRGWYVRVERGICWDFITLWTIHQTAFLVHLFCCVSQGGS